MWPLDSLTMNFAEEENRFSRLFPPPIYSQIECLRSLMTTSRCQNFLESLSASWQ